MDPIANVIGYIVILLASVAASCFILMQALSYVFSKIHIFWRVAFILGQWQRVNYIMEHLPDQYWEERSGWIKFRLKDSRVPVESNPEGSVAAANEVSNG